MTIKGSLGKLERLAAELPPPPPSERENAFDAAYFALPVEQQLWLRWAMWGFTNPEPHVAYPENEAPRYLAGTFPPWGYSNPPEPPAWLPDLLDRLGLPPIAVLREWGESGRLGRGDDDRYAMSGLPETSGTPKHLRELPSAS